jgi:hypothetical protein
MSMIMVRIVSKPVGFPEMVDAIRPTAAPKKSGFAP